METFADYMDTIDTIVTAATGCSVHDLCDAPFADWFEDDVPARIAARRAIRLELS